MTECCYEFEMLMTNHHHRADLPRPPRPPCWRDFLPDGALNVLAISTTKKSRDVASSSVSRVSSRESTKSHRPSTKLTPPRTPKTVQSSNLTKSAALISLGDVDKKDETASLVKLKLMKSKSLESHCFRDKHGADKKKLHKTNSLQNINLPPLSACHVPLDDIVDDQLGIICERQQIAGVAHDRPHSYCYDAADVLTRCERWLASISIEEPAEDVTENFCGN